MKRAGFLALIPALMAPELADALADRLGEPNNNQREDHRLRGTNYRPRVPQTDADHDALARAEAKRQRKANLRRARS